MNGLRNRTRRAGAALAAVALALACVVLPAAAAKAEPVQLTLDQAVAVALEKNNEMAIARAGVDAAMARLGQARAAYFPSVSGSASYTRLDEAPYMDTSQFGNLFAPLMAPFEYLVEQGYLDPSTLVGLQGTSGGKIYLGDDDIYSVGLTVTQPLFTGGAILSAHGAAKHAARAEQLNSRRTTDKVRYDATQAYVALIQSKAALQAMDDAVAEMQSHISDLQAMYDAGMLLESDLMRARVQMSDVELARSRARHGVELANSALGFVLGLGPDAEIEPLDTLNEGVDLVDRDMTSWTALAIEERPDLGSAREMVGAADNAVSLARSGYYPSVVAMGSYMWDRPNREYEPEFYDHWNVTLALQMNVFDWGLTGGKVREARAGLTQAERAYDMMEDAVRLEVRQAYLQRQESLEAVSIAENGLEQARESMRVTRENFKAGQATNSDVLAAQTALTQAWMNRIGALAGLKVAEASLKLATGAAVAEEETR